VDQPSFYLEEYRALRGEIVFTLDHIYNSEIIAALSVVAVYLWLSRNPRDDSFRILWFIPPVLLGAAAVHILILICRLSEMAAYLRTIEEAFRLANGSPGWEHYKLARPRVDTVDRAVATIGWVSSLVGSLIYSWQQYRRRGADPLAR